MSDLFDDPADSRPVQGVSRRTRIVIWAIIALLVILFALSTFAGVWTDHLWYSTLGYGSVFTKVFWVRVGLFFGFGVVMALALGVAMGVAFRTRPFLHPAQLESGLERYRDAVNPIRTWLLVGVALVAGAFAGISAATRWRTFELWAHGTPFGQKDPYFHKDIGFYVFDLPWLHMVVSFVLAASIVALLGNVLVHYLYGGIRLQSPGDRLSSPAQIQISVLLAVFVLAKAADYWLDRYDLTNSQSTLFTGIGFTDDHAVLPAKSTLAGIALICAVLFLVNIWRRTWLLPGVGVALMAISAVLLGLIWPAIVQTVQVNPSRLDKENSYQATNIAQTREAYAIDDAHVKVSDYTADATAGGAAQAKQLDTETSSAPIVDPLLVKDLFEEQQQGRAYYEVAPVLDVDRYTIDGKDRALVLAARELDQDNISASDKNWTNLHTVYTHGSGVIAAYANQRPLSDDKESVDIQWAQGNQADENDLVSAGPGKFEQRIYFGEESNSYSVVGRPAGAKAVELDLPTSSSTSSSTDSTSGASDEDDTRTTYDGKGGVPIGSTWRRLLYAVKFNSANFLLSERVNDNSQVLYNRTPRERVEKVAPWLTLDDDAYPVVANGRITWVLDGYTTTDRYPGSEKESFKTMTNDSLQQETNGLRPVPTDDINYMRNSVKATVDAYDGTVTLYAWDESDPILKTWAKVFPGTVLPKSAIPDWLTPHLRYPEDLFKVQRYQLAKYHVTDAGAFLNGSDWWDVPTDPNPVAGVTSTTLQPPYRLFLDDPEAASTNAEVWSLSTTFTPHDRNNLSAVMTVNSDATSDDYGKIDVLERPDQQTQGPRQVAANMRNDADVAEALLPYTRNNLLSYGSLLTIPTSSHGLVYLMPVYAKQASTSPYPVLAYVLASYNGNVGYGTTLQAALASALEGGSPSTPTPSGTPTAKPTTGPSASPSGSPTSPATGTATPKQLLAQAQELFTEADQAGRAGDYTKRETLLKQAEAKVAAAVEQMGG
ncbi:UPF0182 family protein [Nocardioides sp. Kera G14]|uniref:UPF0182 family membrane protein n=1 Tax=Nocardioides sp. Kera G14 TaxID=2884264 RepID=UPI001D1160E0|nr:UPF0182 family protein [Nocardioides sp. Kera G14]UDY24619.1 UPF0182 family protein [Nocardioides sp. Kera G14]